MDEPRFESPFGPYDVLDKIDSPSWNDQTRRVIHKRLNEYNEALVIEVVPLSRRAGAACRSPL